MNTDEIVRSESAPQAKGQIREGLRYVRSEIDLYVPLVMTAIIGTFAMNFPVVFPLFVKENLGGTDTMFTILYGVVALGSLAGALVAARRTSISHRDVVRGAVLFGVSLMVMAASPSLATTFAASLFVGFASIAFSVGTASPPIRR